MSGETVAKDDSRLMAYGCLDELQSQLGMARSLVDRDPLRTMIEAVQQDIFVAASELASTSRNLADLERRIGPRETAGLERRIDEWTALYGLPTHFVVPGKSVESSALHVARSTCRRCERLITRLNRQVPDYSQLLSYFNRLSDLLFVLAWASEVKTTVEETVRELLRDHPQLEVADQSNHEASRLQKRQASAAAKGTAISYPLAKQLAAIAEKQAAAMGVPMVIALADAAGTLVCFGQMDGALPVSNQLAVAKAFTAAVLRMATRELSRLAQPGGALYGIQQTHQGRIVLLGGGLPLCLQGQVAGAIGISGGTVEQDIQVAQSVVEALAQMAAWAKAIGEALPSDTPLPIQQPQRLARRLGEELKMMDGGLSDSLLTILTGAVLLAGSQ